MKHARTGIAVLCMVCSNAAFAAALGAVKPEPVVPAPATAAPATPATPTPATPTPAPSSAVLAPAPKVDPPDFRSSGGYALSFDLNDGFGLTGLTRLSENSAWLWLLSGDFNRDTGDISGQNYSERAKRTEWGARAAAGYRRYLRPGITNPYMEGLIGLGYRHLFVQSIPDSSSTTPSVETTQTATSLFGAVNVGMEYFFASSFSVEGSVGVAVEYSDRGGDFERSDVNETLDVSGKNTDLRVFQTAVRVKYYW